MNERTTYITAPGELHIVSIRYGGLVNTGDHEHERLEVEALVDSGQSPEEVLYELKRLVKGQLGITRRELITELYNELRRLGLSFYNPEWKNLLEQLTGKSEPECMTEEELNRCVGKLKVQPQTLPAMQSQHNEDMERNMDHPF
ncbi:hypothetical protein [Anthocerotibacter panamensis]|uniref:hypothetical protein n=1 Tax=Anthocerotibacter panamensis TaxID=2857077 RepID=UPI001C401F73|nr:hypothetical protein [Anthocerotibacter panamensis]